MASEPLLSHRRLRVGTALVIGVVIAACVREAGDGDMHTAAPASSDARTTIYDCEMRPGQEAVVKPGAEPRDFFRMSGCEMIFWNPDDLKGPKAEPGR